MTRHPTRASLGSQASGGQQGAWPGCAGGSEDREVGFLSGGRRRGSDSSDRGRNCRATTRVSARPERHLPPQLHPESPARNHRGQTTVPLWEGKSKENGMVKDRRFFVLVSKEHPSKATVTVAGKPIKRKGARSQWFLRSFRWIWVEAWEHLGHQLVHSRVVAGLEHKVAVQVRLQVLPGATTSCNKVLAKRFNTLQQKIQEVRETSGSNLVQIGEGLATTFAVRHGLLARPPGRRAEAERRLGLLSRAADALLPFPSEAQKPTTGSSKFEQPASRCST